MRQSVALCRIPVFLLLALAGFTNAVRAEQITHFDIPEAEVERAHNAELLVIAHLKRGSLHYVQLTGITSEYQATLIIDEVLKGNWRGKELPMIIHNELEPRVANDTNFDHHTFGDEAGEAQSAYDSPIYLFYQAGEQYQVSGDLRQKQLWLLRTHQLNPSPYGDTTKSDTTDIWFPSDIQPADYGLYYQALAGEHAEDKLKKYAAGNSPLAARCQMYLDFLRMKEIVKEPDLEKRVKLLLPYCFYTEDKPETETQRQALLYLSSYCGETGPAALVPIFHDPKYKAMQSAIVAYWCDAKYDKVLVPLFDDPAYANLQPIIFERWRTMYSHNPIAYLIKKLEEQNHFWAEQTADVQDNLARQFSSELPTKEQQHNRDDLDKILSYLRKVPDQSAISVLQSTKQFWDDVDARATYKGLHYRYINNQCDKALDRISKTTSTKNE